MIFQYSQLGFSYAVSAFLLWKAYKQDERYLTVLNNLEALMKKHTEEKDTALKLLASVNCATK